MGMGKVGRMRWCEAGKMRRQVNGTKKIVEG